MCEELVKRLHRYSENCVAYKLDADFASAVQEAADAIEEMQKRIPKRPHSRLIDADEFFKDICNSLNEMTAIGVAVDGEWLWDKLNDALENAPTVIPAEEGE